MRFLLTALTVIFSSTAFAFPTVGDWAKYDGEFTTSDGKKIVYEYMQELVSYNEQTQMFTMRITSQAVGGEKDVQLAEIELRGMPNKAHLERMVGECIAFNKGGTGIRVAVPAGEFNGCFQKNESGYVLVGVVPFGTLRMENRSTNGTAVQTLKAFGMGH